MNLKILPVMLLSALSFGQTSSPLHLEKEIDLPGRLFVSALGNNTVEIIDIKQGQRVTEIKGLKAPQGVLYEPASNRIFVANDRDGLNYYNTACGIGGQVTAKRLFRKALSDRSHPQPPILNLE
jgi:DNA-binding beta-propeller fold protein YncE